MVLHDGTVREVARPDVAGLAFEAAEVARRVHAGETQSERMSWQSTLDVLASLDEVRRQIGVVFPGEGAA